jgi:hypothetical protein
MGAKRCEREGGKGWGWGGEEGEGGDRGRRRGGGGGGREEGAEKTTWWCRCFAKRTSEKNKKTDPAKEKTPRAKRNSHINSHWPSL